MKIFDWFYCLYYHSTMKRGSRDERAVFLFWMPSSFIYVALFYLLLILTKVQIYKASFLPIWTLIFIVNYIVLRKIYIKNGRSKTVLGNKAEVSKFYVLIGTIFSVLSIFLTAIIAIVCTFYYGKNVSFL